MKFFLSSIIFFQICIFTHIDAQECKAPKEITKELQKILNKKEVNEEDFYEINTALFSYNQSELSKIRDCQIYKSSIDSLFNSKNEYKRVIAYRLIGASNDIRFNDKLMERINSNEPSLLNVWSSMALMENKVENASDDLFVVITTKVEDSEAMQILAQIFTKYSPQSVKKTCWKYIESNNKTQQIFAIQILSSMETDDKLQEKLIEFLNEWNMENKGWIIASMGMQKMKNLKPILSKYVTNEDLRSTIINALENSPSESDKEFAKELQK